MGMEGMQSSGPGLMFIALPKVFARMGAAGTIVGAVFFVMVLLAALTSSMSVMEAVVSGLIDKFRWSRHKAVLIEYAFAVVLGIIVCLGYNIFYFEMPLPNGTVGQILDLFDYVSNYVLMPVVAIGTCVLVGWVIKPQAIIDEVTKNGESLTRKGLYVVMVKYVAPVLLAILLLGAFGVF
jgi:NSS family neurotransmitter:Na+ symporter